MGAEALSLHGIHDSVLISGRKSVIICVMLGASPIAHRQCVRLDYFAFYRVEEITAHLLKSKISYRVRYVGAEALDLHGT